MLKTTQRDRTRITLPLGLALALSACRTAAPPIQPGTAAAEAAALVLNQCVRDATNDDLNTNYLLSPLASIARASFTDARDLAWEPPLERDDLWAWLSRRYGVPRVAGGQVGQNPTTDLTWQVTVAARDGVNVTSIATTSGGDCPVTSRRALWHDADGRLIRDRAAVENCEFVDAAIRDTAFTRDEAGRVTTVVVTETAHPTHSHPEHAEGLSAELDVPGLTLTPRVVGSCFADYDALTVQCDGPDEPLTLTCREDSDVDIRGRP